MYLIPVEQCGGVEIRRFTPPVERWSTGGVDFYVLHRVKTPVRQRGYDIPVE